MNGSGEHRKPPKPEPGKTMRNGKVVTTVAVVGWMFTLGLFAIQVLRDTPSRTEMEHKDAALEGRIDRRLEDMQVRQNEILRVVYDIRKQGQ